MSALVETIERPDSFVMPPYPVRRFTVAEYRTLIETGALEEDDRIELLEGWIVPKVVHNPPHDWTVTHGGRVITALFGEDWVVRVQCAINTEDSEPDPDITVVRGPEDRYLQRHPRGEDIGLLIEVAESSLAKDRHKAAIYAAEGVPAYWIVNLGDRQIEVYTEPDALKRAYRKQQVVTPGEAVNVELDGQLIGRLAIDDLLPPAATAD